MLAWRSDGALDSASVRIPAGPWVSIEPRADVQGPWGEVDRLWLGAEAEARSIPLSVIGALDWARITMIPPLAEPARLPPGAGTAVLNLLAQLALEQGVEDLAYRGPYPTEALFLALLESFRPDHAPGDPLARFMANELVWRPAPFVPAFEDTAYVQWRDGRVEKVVWASRTYYRDDWGPVRRAAPLRVHDDGARVRCSLWTLGEAIADHLVVGADGVPHVVAPTSAPASPARAQRLAAAVRHALDALVVALSAPPLAHALNAVMKPMTFTRRSLALDLTEVTDREVAVADAFARRLTERLRAISERDERSHLALSALTELAVALGDPLRLRAQAWLAAAPPEAQAAALARDAHEGSLARTITAGVAALAASGRVDDEPEVEEEEGRDRDH